MTQTERDSMEYDVVVVGAGPAGLSAACRIKQLNSEISVCVIEKGSEIGAHILSGAVIETRALDELFPDWQNLQAPLTTPVTEDRILWFKNDESHINVPHFFAPKTFDNKGNYVVSLGNLCRWLGEQAENLGVDIFPGFTGANLLINDDNQVYGITTGDMGIGRDGEHKDSYTPGIELLAKHTLFAEGCRGHLGKQLIAHFELDKGKDPQHYGLGIKELWQVDNNAHQPGLVVHTSGWPLQESSTGGGGFLYHLENNQVVVGLVVDLSYSNTYVEPFAEFQRYKHHPQIAQYLANGERVSYGARTIIKGGLQSQPSMVFPGGLIIGDNAGTLNNAKIKGTHTAMKSGLLAAETVVDAMATSDKNLEGFTQAYQQSWAHKELQTQRNFGPALHRWGNFWGGAYSFLDLNIFNGKLPWTLHDKTADYATLKTAANSKPMDYPKPDGVLSFDKLSSVFLSNTNHEEDQPIHLTLADSNIPVTVNLPTYAEPAQRYCPAGVYEVIEQEGKPVFQINAQNCVHCKACDIKDPSQNITWVTPEGGGGPNYPNM